MPNYDMIIRKFKYSVTFEQSGSRFALIVIVNLCLANNHVRLWAQRDDLNTVCDAPPKAFLMGAVDVRC